MKAPALAPERSAFTVAEFCARNGIPLPSFSQLEKNGAAPKVVVLARNVRIVTVAEERAWQERMGGAKPDTLPPPERTAFTITEFCRRNSISQALFFTLQRNGRAPQVMAISRTTRLISLEAEQDWQRRMTSPKGREAALQTAERARAHTNALRAGRLSAEAPHHISKQRHATSEATAQLRAEG